MKLESKTQMLTFQLSTVRPILKGIAAKIQMNVIYICIVLKTKNAKNLLIKMNNAQRLPIVSEICFAG